MNDKNTNPVVVTQGIGFSSALCLIFIIFKLLGIIKFSWLWVLSPLWIPIGLYVIIIGLFILIPLIIMGIIFIYEFITDRKEK